MSSKAVNVPTDTKQKEKVCGIMRSDGSSASMMWKVTDDKNKQDINQKLQLFGIYHGTSMLIPARGATSIGPATHLSLYNSIQE